MASEQIKAIGSPYTDPSMTREELCGKYTALALHLMYHTSTRPLKPDIQRFFQDAGHHDLFKLFVAEAPGPEKAARLAHSMATNTHTTMVLCLGPGRTPSDATLAYLYMYMAIEVSTLNPALRAMLTDLISANATYWLLDFNE